MAKAKFDDVRSHVMDCVRVLFEGMQYDVLRTGSQELCVPITNENGDEAYLKVSFSIPTGSRDGDAYDGYAMAEEYKLKCEENARKAKERAEKKAKKIEADKKRREKEGN